MSYANQGDNTVSVAQGGTATPGAWHCHCSQGEPESNDNEEVLHISQSSRTGASPSDGFIQDIRWVWSYSSAEMESVYSAAPAHWDPWKRHEPS